MLIAIVPLESGMRLETSTDNAVIADMKSKAKRHGIAGPIHETLFVKVVGPVFVLFLIALYCATCNETLFTSTKGFLVQTRV